MIPRRFGDAVRMNAAQELWASLGLPTHFGKHPNGGPLNTGRGPTHKGWALHKLRARQRKHGYRKPIGALAYPACGHRP